MPCINFGNLIRKYPKRSVQMRHGTVNKEGTFLVPGKEFSSFMYCVMRYLCSSFGVFSFRKKVREREGEGEEGCDGRDMDIMGLTNTVIPYAPAVS